MGAVDVPQTTTFENINLGLLDLFGTIYDSYRSESQKKKNNNPVAYMRGGVRAAGIVSVICLTRPLGLYPLSSKVCTHVLERYHRHFLKFVFFVDQS
jgi:hypothetical protein